MKREHFLPLFLLFFYFFPVAQTAYGIGVRRVPRETATQGYTIPVTPLGVAISFVEVGETIEYVQISPVGEITVTSNRPLCQGVTRIDTEPSGAGGGFPGFGSGNGVENNSNCSGPVQVLFLKRVSPIFIPGQLPSPSGTALMQVLTTGPEGSYIYQFQLVPSNKKPEFTVVNVSGRIPVAGSQLLQPTAPPLPSMPSMPSEPTRPSGEGIPNIPSFGVPRPPSPPPAPSIPPSGSGLPPRPPSPPAAGTGSAPGAPPPPAPSVPPGASPPGFPPSGPGGFPPPPGNFPPPPGGFPPGSFPPPAGFPPGGF